VRSEDQAVAFWENMGFRYGPAFQTSKSSNRQTMPSFIASPSSPANASPPIYKPCCYTSAVSSSQVACAVSTLSNTAKQPEYANAFRKVSISTLTTLSLQSGRRGGANRNGSRTGAAN
jgi:hypothetical protein